VGIDRKVGENISGAKEEIHKETSISSIKLRQKK